MSFPRNLGQVPIYYNALNTGRPVDADKNVFWSHYSDVEKTPQFAFGHGLSYTTFKYSAPKANKTTYTKGEAVKIQVNITNTGAYDGKEVAQLYMQDVTASLARPIKELKGFEMVSLKKGESKTVTFTLTDNELGFYDNNGNYIIEPGIFKVFVGSSSADVQELEFELK